MKAFVYLIQRREPVKQVPLNLTTQAIGNIMIKRLFWCSTRHRVLSVARAVLLKRASPGEPRSDSHHCLIESAKGTEIASRRFESPPCSLHSRTMPTFWAMSTCVPNGFDKRWYRS